MDCRDIFEGRRAVNFFDPNRPVPEETLKQMILLASKAPSSFNLQPWNLMVLKDPEKKLRLRKVAWDQPKVSEAPVVFIVLGDREGWKAGHPTAEKVFNNMVTVGGLVEAQHDWFMEACKSIYGDSPDASLAFACKNAGLFAMSLMYAGKCLGLETHPMDGIDREGIRKEFNIPGRFWIPLIMAVGYFAPGKTLMPPKWRKSIDEIVVEF